MRHLVTIGLVLAAALPTAADTTSAERGDLMAALVESEARIDDAAGRWGYDDPRTWDAFHAYADVSFVSGDRSTAWALGELLLRDAQARRPGDTVRLARALLLVARVERLGDEARARGLLDRALDLEEVVARTDAELWASIVHQDATMRRHLTPAAAIERYREAVRIREALSPRPRWSLAETLTWLGWNLREQGRMNEAGDVLRRADAMLTALGLDQSFERAVVDGALGSLALATDDLAAARRRFANRDAVLESLWDRAPAGFQRRRLTNDGPTPLAFVQLLDGRLEPAWETAMRREGRVNSDLQQLARWQRLDPDGFREARELRRARAARPHLQDLVPRGDWATVHDVLRLRTRLLRLETEFLTRFPPPDVTVRDIQLRLDDDEAYIGWLHYAFGDGHLNASRESSDYMLGSRWLYVIRRDSFRMVEVARSESTGGLARLRWTGERYGRRLALAAAWPTAVEHDPLIEREALRVGTQLFGAYHHLLDGVRHLIVQSSFVTPVVPLESLRLPDGRWLSDRFTTTYSMSAPAFVLLHDAGAAPATAAALLVGDTDPTRLPHVRRELAALARTFERHVALKESGAVEAELLDVADGTGAFAVAHLAGHFETERFVERNGMALAGGDVLEAHEVLNAWRLNAELVTLSGCRSIDARGYNARVLPFVQALLTTGARRVVGSVFDVDDEATMHLMLRFYENLVGDADDARSRLSPREALREARTWLRNYRDASGSYPYRHPSYWAGFALIGAP